MDTRGKIIQRLRYVPTILWVILAFLIVLGAAAYVSQDETDVTQEQNETVAETNGENDDTSTEAANESDAEEGEETDQSAEEGTSDEELPSELAATGPVEDIAVMVAVTSTLGVLYLGSRKRLEAERRN